MCPEISVKRVRGSVANRPTLASFTVFMLSGGNARMIGK